MNQKTPKNAPISIAIALGANLGEQERTFAEACRRLAEAGLAGIRMSRIFRTVPVDCPPGTPDFANAVLLGEWPDGDALSLLRTMQTIEVALGRPADHGFHTSRTLDLDLIWFGEERWELPELTVPHPRALEREFVLEPLAELAGERRWPGRDFTVMEALAALRCGNAKK